MEIEDGSDDEGPRSSSKQAGASKDDGVTDSMQEQAIDENQMINEEYKIWSVASSSSKPLEHCTLYTRLP